ncbi:MAG: zinc ribbon domain-containing protein [Firmicutes bacterium]|nr:zinc ribbon domain-containing protein [Bacillota bacterium]
MKCPNCGKEVNESLSLCDGCGTSLYGPRSINLNELGGNNTIQSNNITSITGIDINDIAPIQSPPINNNSFSLNDKNQKKEKSDLKINMGTILFLIVIAVLLILSVYLFLQNRKLLEENNNQSPIVTPPAQNVDCVEGYYGLTSAYSFLLPDNWIYSQTANEVVLTNGEISMLIFKTSIGKVDHITSEALKNEYIKQGYPIVMVEEATLNSRKIMYVKYNANNMNFVDFYYQYDSEKIIYGQISSSKVDILTTDVKNIISSVTIQTRDNNITVGKAPVTYENILSLMN